MACVGVFTLTVSLPYGRFLGYDKGEDGLPEINEEEAVIIRKIYRMFLEGATPYAIAKHLTAEGIPTPGGKVRWQHGTVKSILTNEKYAGNAILQKTFTVDFLTKKKKVNEGEIPQYYVENSHPAIIEPDVYNMVQKEFKRRKKSKHRYSGSGLFASKIICGECGSFYGAKVWHSNSKYRRVIYQCNNKFKNSDKCKTPHLNEETIKELFVKAVNRLLSDRDKVLNSLESVRRKLSDTSALDAQHDKLQGETTVIAEMIQKCVNENALVAQSQKEYCRQYEGLVGHFEAAKNRLEEIASQREERRNKLDVLGSFVNKLRQQGGLISEFDERLWYTLVNEVVVYSEGDIRFKFKDGTEIKNAIMENN